MRRSKVVRSSSWIHIVTCIAAFLFVSLSSTLVFAQSQANKDQAKRLFDEGKSAFERKDFNTACAKFKESYELVKGVGSQYFLARCLTEQNKTATAYRHFKEVAEISARVGQQERAQVARDRMRELEPRLMKIRIDVASPAPGLVIDCDGIEIPESEWGTPKAYDPGTHYVNANAPGAAPWEYSVELTGEGTVVTVVVPDLSATGGGNQSAGGGCQWPADRWHRGGGVGRGRARCERWHGRCGDVEIRRIRRVL